MLLIRLARMWRRLDTTPNVPLDPETLLLRPRRTTVAPCGVTESRGLARAARR